MLKTESDGSKVIKKQLLGTGGQGEVYKVECPGGREMAMKWYSPAAATRSQRRQLQRLIQRGAPSADFLWPQEIVEDGEQKGFGYLMELRPSGFHSVVDLMAGRVDPSFRVLARTGLNLANAFLALHAQGLCYGDISFGNVFFHPKSGQVRICDNDNVVIDGSDKIGIMGTPRFMAPEIVRGEGHPCSDTDRYSLAVLLFYLLMVHHPLEGKREHEIRCLDLPAMERLYGEEPRFIFDPDDHSNAPVPGVHDTVALYWSLYPGALKNLFEQAFTRGLDDPRGGRVRESQWRRAMMELMDSVMDCECGAEVIYDVEYLRANQGQMAPCWSCGKRPSLAPRMKIGKRVVVMSEETKLYATHLQKSPGKYDLTRAQAVVQRSRDFGLVLKNCSHVAWSVTARDRSTSSVQPGQAVPLRNGLQIQFGQVQGRVRSEENKG